VRAAVLPPISARLASLLHDAAAVGHTAQEEANSDVSSPCKHERFSNNCDDAVCMLIQHNLFLCTLIFVIFVGVSVFLSLYLAVCLVL